MHNICALCRSPFKTFELNQDISLKKLVTQSTNLWLQTDNRGSFAGDLLDLEILALRKACDIHDPNSFNKFHWGFPASLCIFEITRNLYNFTYYMKDHSATMEFAYFEGINSLFLSDINFEIMKQYRKHNWVPRTLVLDSLKFKAFQRKPQITTETFVLKPYDNSSWILLLVIIVLLVIAMWPSRVRGVWNMLELVEVVLFACVEQSVKVRKSNKLKILYQMQNVCWMLWILATVLIANGYKGEICSIFTMGINVNWPKNISQLREDDSYSMLICEVAFIGMEKVALPEAFFRQNPVNSRNHNLIEYDIMQRLRIETFV